MAIAVSNAHYYDTHVVHVRLEDVGDADRIPDAPESKRLMYPQSVQCKYQRFDDQDWRYTEVLVDGSVVARPKSGATRTRLFFPRTQGDWPAWLVKLVEDFQPIREASVARDTLAGSTRGGGVTATLSHKR
jgi:hypothetical protein